MENELNFCFEQKFARCSYGVGIGRAWCSREAFEIYTSLLQKNILEENIYLHTSGPNNNRAVLGLKEF
jgi:hypothetical protein